MGHLQSRFTVFLSARLTGHSGDQSSFSASSGLTFALIAPIERSVCESPDPVLDNSHTSSESGAVLIRSAEKPVELGFSIVETMRVAVEKFAMMNALLFSF
jgi:hypothetical protein